MADASDFFTNLAKHLGGDKTTGGGAKVDPQTGEITNYTPTAAKHPFLARVSGKASEIDKLNQMMQLLQMQQNAKVGNQRLTHTQDIDKMGQAQNISLLNKTDQPYNPQTTKGLNETEYNANLLKLLQESVGAGAKASTAKSGASVAKSNLEGKQATTEIENFNPGSYMDNLKAQLAKSLGITLQSGEIGGTMQPDGSVKKFGQGATTSEEPVYDEFKGMKMFKGTTRRTTPGNFYPNGKAALDRAAGANAETIEPDYMEMLRQQLGSPMAFVGGFGNLQGTQSTASPTALGLDPSVTAGARRIEMERNALEMEPMPTFGGSTIPISAAIPIMNAIEQAGRGALNTGRSAKNFAKKPFGVPWQRTNAVPVSVPSLPVEVLGIPVTRK